MRRLEQAYISSQAGATDPSSAVHCQRLLWSGRFSKGNSRRLGWSPRPFFHHLRGRRHLRGSNPVSAHAKQAGGNVGHDLRRCGIRCYELCRTPHTAAVKSPWSLPLLLNRVLGHALFVGLPIAVAARRITNQPSFSAQAA